jgi:CCR4-NOT transcription complex subunit 2
MLGLLATIRSRNPDLSLLAHGVDLTGLGLNLNSSEPLYPSFTSPFLHEFTSDGLFSSVSVSTERPEIINDAIPGFPSCYSLCNVALKPAHFKRFTIETLALIFYGYPRDLVQVYAALEWFNRGWRYHKELKIWFARASSAVEGSSIETADGKSPQQNGNQLVYFDIQSWTMKPFTSAMPPANFVRNFLTEAELREMIALGK